MKFTAILSCFLALFLFIACGGEQRKSTPTPTKQESSKVTKEEPKEAPAFKPLPAEQIAKAKEIIAAAKADEVAKVNGRTKFNTLCGSCHGTNGKLKINGAPDLTISTVSLEESVGLIQHGRGMMTPFKGLITEAEMVAIAKYSETFR